jgi:hypothetical protein
MGALLKLTDAVLFLFFLVIALAAPLIDAQTCLPHTLFPQVIVDLKNWYSHEYGDYLVAEKPHFFVGIVWLELLFQWPLALLNLYGILGGKPWFNTTCLLYGASCITSMVISLSLSLSSMLCWVPFHSKNHFFFTIMIAFRSQIQLMITLFGIGEMGLLQIFL